MTHLVGDPASLMLRPEATEEQRLAVRERLGLNDPILVQFGRFLGGVVRGDFGDSIWQRGVGNQSGVNCVHTRGSSWPMRQTEMPRNP